MDKATFVFEKRAMEEKLGTVNFSSNMKDKDKKKFLEMAAKNHTDFVNTQHLARGSSGAAKGVGLIASAATFNPIPAVAGFIVGSRKDKKYNASYENFRWTMAQHGFNVSASPGGKSVKVSKI